MQKNILLTIEYAGKNYSGWQTQKNGISIQQTIEKAISDVTRQSIKINGSGRTDAFVNAIGQCANFKIESNIPAERFAPALNSVLPGDIRILSSVQVASDFHARYSATGKHYRYTILNRQTPSALYRDGVCHIKQPLDIEKMRKACSYFIGVHNFAAFMSTGSKVKNTVRSVYKLDITDDLPYIYMDIQGDGFLYNMVRIIAGTLVQVGSGKIHTDDIIEIIQRKDRSLAGPTLKAAGLCLVEVFYD